jgi:hypothetical protein
MTVVVDTNVILVANRQHAHVSETCIVSCAQKLQAIRTDGRVAIDDGYRILQEYQNNTAPRAGKGAGDIFLKWLLRNNANTARCDQVKLVEHAEREFESFPDEVRLAGFDRSDRKFVAVAAAHPARPPIAQAADSKWIGWAEALRDHGVTVDFLCPADIQGFDEKKKARNKKSR